MATRRVAMRRADNQSLRPLKLADALAILTSIDGSPNVEINTLAGESDRPIAQESVNASGVVAASRREHIRIAIVGLAVQVWRFIGGNLRVAGGNDIGLARVRSSRPAEDGSPHSGTHPDASNIRARGSRREPIRCNHFAHRDGVAHSIHKVGRRRSFISLKPVA